MKKRATKTISLKTISLKTTLPRAISLSRADQSEMRAFEMMNRIFLALMILFILAIISVANVAAQSGGQEPSAQPQTSPNNSRQSSQGKEEVGPSADTIRPYRPSGRDPFKKAIKKAKTIEKTNGPRPVPPPPLDIRRAEFRQKVDAARSRNMPEPNPVAQYLVSELIVTGIFTDAQGNGAFVKAQPTGTMFFIRRGTACYNGEVLRIETDESDAGAKVLFREVSYMEFNGKRSPQERVVGKLPGASEK